MLFAKKKKHSWLATPIELAFHSAFWGAGGKKKKKKVNSIWSKLVLLAMILQLTAVGDRVMEFALGGTDGMIHE